MEVSVSLLSLLSSEGVGSNSNEASPQTAELYGQERGNYHRIESGLRSSRQGRCPGHESSKLVGRETRGRPESAMSVARSVADVLRNHVVLELEAIDRMYLNVYVPHLQTHGRWSDI